MLLGALGPEAAAAQPASVQGFAMLLGHQQMLLKMDVPLFTAVISFTFSPLIVIVANTDPVLSVFPR